MALPSERHFEVEGSAMDTFSLPLHNWATRVERRANDDEEEFG
jgi:hypothetical protein